MTKRPDLSPFSTSLSHAWTSSSTSLTSLSTGPPTIAVMCARELRTWGLSLSTWRSSFASSSSE
eukprot:scaffold55700_cov65-Phaeocystis_antarctica.AAC.1